MAYAPADQPDDYVVATGETYSVKDFLTEAFKAVNLDWEKYVEIDPRYFRPAEVELLIGDPTKAKQKLNWTPKTSFKELVKIMVEADLQAEGISLKDKLAYKFILFHKKRASILLMPFFYNF